MFGSIDAIGGNAVGKLKCLHSLFLRVFGFSMYKILLFKVVGHEVFYRLELCSAYAVAVGAFRIDADTSMSVGRVAVGHISIAAPRAGSSHLHAYLTAKYLHIIFVQKHLAFCLLEHGNRLVQELRVLACLEGVMTEVHHGYSSSAFSENSKNAGTSVVTARQRQATAQGLERAKASRTIAMESAGVPITQRHTKAFESFPLNNWLAVTLTAAK